MSSPGSDGQLCVVLQVRSKSSQVSLQRSLASRAPRTKEYERALTLLDKGQHSKSSVLKGLPTPTSDAEWDQWHESHGSLFFCLRELSGR